MTTVQEELAKHDSIGKTQLGFLLMTGIGAFGIFIAGFFWPDFFQYRYLFISSTFLSDVARFWPAFAWAGGLTLLLAMSGAYRSTLYDEVFLNRGLISSIGAGITEEAWFRGVGVFYTMIGLIILNWLLSVAGWLFVGLSGLAILGTIVSIFARTGVTFLGLIARAFGIAMSVVLIYALVTFNHDPLYQLYERIFYPIINWTTFGTFAAVFEGNHQPFLVMGLISSNFAFRDGHKYQGFFGWSNSWFMGCVFIFATLTYGLWVAIAVHALYDILIDVIRYFGRKVWG